MNQFCKKISALCDLHSSSSVLQFVEAYCPQAFAVFVRDFLNPQFFYSSHTSDFWLDGYFPDTLFLYPHWTELQSELIDINKVFFYKLRYGSSKGSNIIPNTKRDACEFI